jgi:hypothetical protein
MSDDEFEDEPELDEEDLDEDALDEEDFDDDDELVDDDLADDDDLGDAEVVDESDPMVVPVATVEAAEAGETTDEEEDDVVDLDEELHPDDVEEALDVVLRERTVAAGLEGEEDEDEPDEPGEGGTKIVPRRENEFLCRSCFLVLPRHQLADESRMICRDCA